MVKLTDLKKVHLIGIKGTGMSALALALRSLGVNVSGSDAKDSFLLLPRKYFAKIAIAPDFSEKNITNDIDAVIASTAHTSKNVEISEAQRRKIPVLTYPEMIGLLTKQFKTIAVCGSHGKTTTTNMLAHVFQQAGMSVLALAGPTSRQVIDVMEGQSIGFLSKAYRSPDGDEIAGRDFQQKINDRFAKNPMLCLVLEADEYENKLKYYSPFGVILTNIELDHPDFFKTKRQYERVFLQFVQRVPSDGFFIDGRQTPYKLGEHNKFNARLVRLAARKLGLTDKQISDGIKSFRGSPRRMEIVNKKPLIIDDYGHHPTEIRMTLRALRKTHKDKRIIAVFHPHTYSRTKKFLKEFGASFADADHVIVLDIFESREVGQQTITSKDVVDEIIKNGKDAHYCPTFQSAANFLKNKLNDHTLLLTIGAGDVWKLHKLLC